MFCPEYKLQSLQLHKGRVSVVVNLHSRHDTLLWQVGSEKTCQHCEHSTSGVIRSRHDHYHKVPVRRLNAGYPTWPRLLSSGPGLGRSDVVVLTGHLVWIMSSLSRGGGEERQGIKRKLHIKRMLVEIRNKNNNYRGQPGRCDQTDLVKYEMEIINRIENTTEKICIWTNYHDFCWPPTICNSYCYWTCNKISPLLQKASWPQKYNLVLTARTGTDSYITNYF